MSDKKLDHWETRLKMVHDWSIDSGERFQGHQGPLVIYFSSVPIKSMFKGTKKKKNKTAVTSIFSLPEHNMLKGSF